MRPAGLPSRKARHVALIAILLALASPFLLRDRITEWLRTSLERRATDAVGVPVHIDSVVIRLVTFRPRVEAIGIRLALPEGDRIEAGRTEIFLGLGRLNVEVEAPHIRASVERGLPSLASGGDGFRFGTLVLKNGTVEVTSDRGLDVVLEHVDALVTHENAGVVFDVRAAGRHVRARAGAQKIDESIHSFDGQIILRAGTVEIRGGRLETGDATVFVEATATLGGTTKVEATRLEITAPLPQWRGLAGTITWHGAATLDAGSFRGSGSVEIAAGPTHVGGTVSFEGTSEPFTATGETALAWEGLSTGRSTRIPNGAFSGSFDADRERVVIRDGLASAGVSRIAVDGVVALDGAVELSFDAAPLALGELSPIEGVEIAGAGPVTAGRVTGSLDAPVVEGAVELAGFRVAGLDFGDGAGHVRVDFARAAISSPQTSFLRGESGYGGAWTIGLGKNAHLEAGSREQPISIVGARLEDLAAIGLLPIAAGATGRVTRGSLWLSGPLDALDGNIRATAENLEIHGQRFASVQVNGRLDAGAVRLDDVLARRASGAQVFARGSIGAAPERELNLELHTAALTLADLDPVATRLPSALTSAVTLRAKAVGTLAEPDVSGALRFDDTRFAGRPLGDSSLDVRTEGGELVVTGTLAGGRLTPFARITRTGIAATFGGPAGERFTATASRASGEWTVRGAGTVDLGLVPLFTGRLSRMAGVLDVSRLDASAAHHHVEGTVRGGAMAVAALPIAPADVTGAFVLDDGVLSVTALGGTLGGGTFRLASAGTATISRDGCLEALSIPGVALSSVTARLESRGVTARVSGPLRVDGGTCGASIPTVAGDLVVEQAKYSDKAGKPGTPRPSTDESTGPSIAVDVTLSAPGGGLVVKTGDLKAELATRVPLRVIGDDTALGIDPGSLRLVAGTLSVQGIDFALRRADVTFAGSREIDAIYTVIAAKKLGPFEVTIRADGRLSGGAPKIDVSTTPRLSEKDARKLLEKHRIDEQRLRLDLAPGA